MPPTTHPWLSTNSALFFEWFRAAVQPDCQIHCQDMIANSNAMHRSSGLTIFFSFLENYSLFDSKICDVSAKTAAVPQTPHSWRHIRVSAIKYMIRWWTCFCLMKTGLIVAWKTAPPEWCCVEHTDKLVRSIAHGHWLLQVFCSHIRIAVKRLTV